MNNLINAVKEYQQSKDLTDIQLAKLLGIDRSTWAYIKSGKRNPGMKFLRAVNDKLIPVRISDTINHNAPEKHQNRKSAAFVAWLKDLYLKFKRSYYRERTE